MALLCLDHISSLELEMITRQVRFSGKTVSYTADMEPIIRCSYCLVGIELRPMIAYKDGRFVCRDCCPHGAPRIP